MSRFNPHHDSVPVLDAARRWRDRCWVGEKSVFRDERLWASENIAACRAAFVDHPDDSDASFYDKLEGQLEKESPDVKKLMAEMLWILLLFQSNVTARKKREGIRRVWSWSGDTLSDTEAMIADNVIEGLGSAGQGFNNYRWKELALLIDASSRFKSEPPTMRQRLVSDAWSFAEWLTEVPREGQRQFGHILRYLMFPEQFERIASFKDKKSILAGVGGMSSTVTKKWTEIETDRALLELRERLTRELGTADIDFYYAPLVGRWRREARTWLLAWNPSRWEWKEFSAQREQVRTGNPVQTSWSCASHDAKEGDVAFLMRLGVNPKGVIARGSLLSRLMKPNTGIAREMVSLNCSLTWLGGIYGIRRRIRSSPQLN
jgi:5-methylcytosine-specific restriction protein B